VQRQWVKVNGVWREINEVYVKSGGSWNLVAGSLPAVFTKVSGSFGVSSRPQDPEFIETPPAPPPSGGGGDGNGGYPGPNTDGVNGGPRNELGFVGGFNQNADGSIGNENQA
jgi:hypothetical protein